MLCTLGCSGVLKVAAPLPFRGREEPSCWFPSSRIMFPVAVPLVAVTCTEKTTGWRKKVLAVAFRTVIVLTAPVAVITSVIAAEVLGR